MRDERVIRQNNYIKFSFNGGVEDVYFDNFEVLGDLEYFPDTTQEMQVSESGASFSLSRKQVEKFRFSLNYENRATRAKIETLRKYMAGGYQLEFTVSKFPTVFTGSDFTSTIPTDEDPEVLTQEIVFGKAVIDLPSDFSFDRGARGEGMTILDGIECTVSKSGTLPVPVSECSLVSAGDFDFVENFDQGTNELISFTIAPDASGLIDTIDGTPVGTIIFISGGSGQGGTSSQVSYNGAQSRYEIDSAPFVIDGLYTISINNIPITLKTGQTCSFSLSVSIQYFVNTVPVASDVVITGTPRQGETLAGISTYSDAQGDLEDTTPVDRLVWYSFPTEAEALAGDLTNATQLGTGSSYTIGSGIVGEFIAFAVKPYALTGASPGVQVFSNVIGPISTNIVAYTAQNNMTGGMSIVHKFDSDDTIGIDWGDGTFETFNANSSSIAYNHTYSSGTRTASIYCNPDNVGLLKLSSEELLSLDVSDLDELSSLEAVGNSNLRVVTLPVANNATWEVLRLDSCDLLGTLDASGIGSAPPNMRVHLNPSLAGLIMPADSSPITKFWAYSTSIASLDFSGNDIGGDIRIHSNSALASVNFGGVPNTTPIVNLQAYGGAISGTLDISPLLLGGVVQVSGNSAMTGLTLPTTSAAISAFQVNGCDLPTLDLSTLTGLGGDIRFHINTSLSSVTFPATSQLITRLKGNNCELTSIDLSPLTNLSGRIELYMNTTMNTLTMPSSNANDITELQLYGCDLTYFDLTGNSFSENVVIDISDNDMSADDVDHLLVDLDATLSAGVGTIDISGTNDAPTNGAITTYDGIAAATSLAGKGYTVITT